LKQDSRRYPRFDVTRTARVRRIGENGDAVPSAEAVGTVANLSASGVSLADVEPDLGLATGDAVDVDVDGMQPRQGRVVRADGGVLAVDFGLDDDGEQSAFAELGVVTGELSRLLKD
jgi:hypothetical protein